ncbi:MAG: HD domain-containing protein [Solirubrobacterales bacterium]
MSRPRVGTWSWAQQTGGRLSRREQLAMLAQGMRARIALLPNRSRGGVASHSGPLELPIPPDSKLAREADEYVQSVSSPDLFGHCVRTWMFGTMIADRQSLDHDPELLYLASAMHDLGLTDAHGCKDPTAHCFAVEGARGAHDFLTERDVPQPRAETVAEAISLHLNVAVPLSLGHEAHLLSAGAQLDALGAGRNRLRPEQIATVLDRWPRGDLASELHQSVGRQVRARPRSRVALLWPVGLKGMFVNNPLDR